jgi:hypothetical protein
MKVAVTLYESGTTFEEVVIARDYQQANQKALARNPGSTIISTTAIFDQPDHNTSWTEESSYNERYSSSDSSSSSSGFGGLAVLAIGGWIAWEAWKFGSAIIVGAWQWIVSVAQGVWGLFSWIPFMSPQLVIGIIFGFFLIVLILGLLDD